MATWMLLHSFYVSVYSSGKVVTFGLVIYTMMLLYSYSYIIIICYDVSQTNINIYSYDDRKIIIMCSILQVIKILATHFNVPVMSGIVSWLSPVGKYLYKIPIKFWYTFSLYLIFFESSIKANYFLTIWLTHLFHHFPSCYLVLLI